MMKTATFAAAAAAIVATGSLIGVSGAVAQEGQQALKPPEAIIQQLEKEFGGRVTDFELDREWNGDFYEIELVDGERREWDIEVDARTGEVVYKREDRD